MTVAPPTPEEEAALLELVPRDAGAVSRLHEEALRQEEEDRRARVALAERSILFFARYYFPDFFSDATPWFHQELIDIAREMEQPRKQRGVMGAVLAAPRGHAKSTILTFLIPLYWLCFRRRRFIVIVSDTGHAAEGFVSDIKKQLEENERLREDFGDLCGDTVAGGRPLKWTTADFTAAHKSADGRPVHRCRVLARSTGGQFRGLRSGSSRPDAIICDDLENDEHVKTPEQRAKLWNWFNKAVVPAMDPHVGALIVVGTIIHFDSLLAKLLKLAQTTELYRWRIFRAYLDDGSILWPERFSRELLEQRKQGMGTLAFNSEYLNIPIDEESRLYRPEWMRWYTGQELRFNEESKRWMFRGEPLEIYIGIDPAISEKESADYFAVVVMGLARKSKALVVLYSFQGRMDFPTQVQEVIRLDATWHPTMIGIEENAYQRALPQQLIRESAQLRIKRLSNRAEKYTRILAASVPFENGQVWMRQAVGDERGELDESGAVRVHFTVADLYTQMMQYPASAHDDLLDAMENSMQLARVKGRAFEDWF